MTQKPQFADMQALYIPSFTQRYYYDREGNRYVEPVERNLQPTGIAVLDHWLQALSKGKTDSLCFCYAEGIDLLPFSGFIQVLTGMNPTDFRDRYLLLLADDLLRYTDLKAGEIGRRIGMIGKNSFNKFMKRVSGATPIQRRNALRQPGDLNRYVW